MRTFLLLALLLVTAPSLLAHDFWLEPSNFRPSDGETVMIALRVGENLAGDPVPRRSSRIVRFVARDMAGERAIEGLENEDPAGMTRVDGPTVIAYEGKPTPHVISREKFEQFAREEGVTHLAKKVDAQVRERFTRYVKSILGESTAAIEEPLGMRFELVPDRDLRSFRLLCEGKPLRGALVIALQAGGKRHEARSDTKGRVTLPTGDEGVWLVKAVHLVRAPADSGSTWESLWASVTFQR
ncbi:MAG TPA: DUF4198 domain-containing protein [Thermoanaerobaculia bacterium]|jgi:hypothetical protein